MDILEPQESGAQAPPPARAGDLPDSTGLCWGYVRFAQFFLLLSCSHADALFFTFEFCWRMQVLGYAPWPAQEVGRDCVKEVSGAI